MEKFKNIRGAVCYLNLEGLHGIVRDWRKNEEYYFTLDTAEQVEELSEAVYYGVDFDLVFNHQARVYMAQNVRPVLIEEGGE